LTGHSWQWGLRFVQIVCPNPMKSFVIWCQYSWGSHFCNWTRVESSLRVWTQPRRLQTRWTCVSTPIPTDLPQATFRRI
jgi:hypothetical protein